MYWNNDSRATHHLCAPWGLGPRKRDGECQGDLDRVFRAARVRYQQRKVGNRDLELVEDQDQEHVVMPERLDPAVTVPDWRLRAELGQPVCWGSQHFVQGSEDHVVGNQGRDLYGR